MGASGADHNKEQSFTLRAYSYILVYTLQITYDSDPVFDDQVHKVHRSCRFRASSGLWPAGRQNLRIPSSHETAVKSLLARDLEMAKKKCQVLKVAKKLPNMKISLTSDRPTLDVATIGLTVVVTRRFDSSILTA